MSKQLPPNVYKCRNATYYAFFIIEDVEVRINYKIADDWWFGTKPHGIGWVSLTDEEVEKMVEKYSLRDHVKIRRKNESSVE